MDRTLVVALVCLWIGFALGFVCAAVLRRGDPRAEAVGNLARPDHTRSRWGIHRVRTQRNGTTRAQDTEETLDRRV